VKCASMMSSKFKKKNCSQKQKSDDYVIGFHFSCCIAKIYTLYTMKKRRANRKVWTIKDLWRKSCYVNFVSDKISDEMDDKWRCFSRRKLSTRKGRIKKLVFTCVINWRNCFNVNLFEYISCLCIKYNKSKILRYTSNIRKSVRAKSCW